MEPKSEFSAIFEDSRHTHRPLQTHTSKSIELGASMESGEFKKELAELHKSSFGWAMVCCGRDQDLAREILQQAYCRILSGDASFAGNSEFSTWVFGVIRRVALEELRRQRRQRQRFTSNTQIAADTCALHDSNLLTLEQRELAEQLCAALEHLSHRQREVLHLTFYENMTIQQAARAMDISIGSARQHYQRGKSSLRRILASRRELEH